MNTDVITLDHGAGGEATHRLIADVRETLRITAALDDSFRFRSEGECAVTTDGYVITPRFFPGGDIGKLAALGTANDLACVGAELQYVALTLIIEEGFTFAELGDILNSMRATLDAIGAHVVTGDCKVVGKGQADGLFIVTTGYGPIRAGVRQTIIAGDRIIISGTAGDHGMAVMTRRAGINLESPIESDCAPLFPLVRAACGAAPGAVKFIRDATRGGVAAVVNEIAVQCGCGARVTDGLLPVKPAVRAACDLVGLDPWHIANEGKLIMVVAAAAADDVLLAVRSEEPGADAAILGEITGGAAGKVYLRTVAGVDRLLLPISGEPLPRIC